MVELDASQKCSFGGHESFPIRYGWLKKAVDSVALDNLSFSQEDALISLGVGKNMVRAIKHWALATQMVAETANPTTKRNSLHVTPLGSALLLDGGWDPFLEDPASLWLVHWHLVSELTRAALWHLIFTVCPRREFTRDDVSEFASIQFRRLSILVTKSVIDRDVDCFVRTYVPTSMPIHDEEQRRMKGVDRSAQRDELLVLHTGRAASHLLAASSRAFLTVPIVGSRSSLALSIVRGVERCLEQIRALSSSISSSFFGRQTTI